MPKSCPTEAVAGRPKDKERKSSVSLTEMEKGEEKE